MTKFGFQNPKKPVKARNRGGNPSPMDGTQIASYPNKIPWVKKDRRTITISGFDNIIVRMGWGYNLLSPSEFLAIPDRNRMKMILAGRVQFYLNGSVVSARKALKALKCLDEKRQTPPSAKFDTAFIQKSFGFNLYDRKQFLTLPLQSRMKLIVDGKVIFLLNGEIIPIRDALPHCLIDQTEELLHAQRRLKTALRDLVESERKLWSITESALETIITFSPNGKIRTFNQEAEKTFGHLRENIIGKDFIEMFITEESRSIIREELNRFQTTQNSNLISNLLETTLLDHSGEPVHVELTIFPEHDPPTPLFRAHIRDISARIEAEEALRLTNENLETMVYERTVSLQEASSRLQAELEERKQLEKQLVQAQKLESLGQMAAGIAHEINNPIAFVVSNMSVLRQYSGTLQKLFGLYRDLLDHIPEDAMKNGAGELIQALKALETIEAPEEIISDLDPLLSETSDGLDRVREIVSGLRTFSRIDDSGFKDTDVNLEIEETLKLIQSELKHKCTVIKEFGTLPLINGNPIQLNQVFMNILVNAAHAIEDNGVITIRTKQQSDQVHVEISDTGGGISSEHIENIFDPFFTTKPVGVGTGLGLPISYGIVQKHQGSINVESKPGTGTTFTLTFPVQETDDN